MEIQLWREILTPYELAVRELTVKFEHLMKEYRDRGMYSPIEQVTGRVKTISSILEKAQKKQIPIEKIEENMYDIAGVRIICQFVEDIQMVVEMIRKRSDMKVQSERDYVNHVKESGYRSYHMIISYEVQTLYGARTILAELQVRTLGMNFWSIIEHSMQYKYHKNIPEHIRKKLLKAAQAIVVLDKEMSSVRSEIMDAQNSFQIQANLVSEILNNIQNLYHLANKREIIKIQDEFYRIYEMNDIERLQRFNKELDLIAEGYRAQALDQYT
ncbi:MAG: GTP pyrophosphokinase family protein [Lachnospiraceae bacterium]|nr:GTP pyrophosphokinase family protein [Lachnospiraceae bacterium]MDD3794827.1 GTP pyrophosphokinase family protein [Lachnospiraceae bacterium]